MASMPIMRFCHFLLRLLTISIRQLSFANYHWKVRSLASSGLDSEGLEVIIVRCSLHIEKTRLYELDISALPRARSPRLSFMMLI